ncbi:hypothetical protein [Clostridium guangxiense]|nr:hypothetical protein [Clostridium guangxiense]MCD2346237.1 hypothetical protein [Clostridium guangxiense]
MLKKIINKIFNRNKKDVKYKYYKPNEEQRAYAKKIYEETGERVVL